MATTPNQKPAPSEDYVNMRFNAGKLDEFITSTEESYTDRLGVSHLTVLGLQNAAIGALIPANNLSDVDDAATSRVNIGAAASGANIDITSISGNAATATALATPRTFITNLASTSAAFFSGAANNSHGVTGVLPVASGGTGQADISYVRAEDSTSVSVPVTTFTKLSPTEVTDLKGEYSAGDFTPVESGYYQLTGSARMDVGVSTSSAMMLKIDSSTAPSGTSVLGQSANAYAYNCSPILQVSCIIYMTAGSSVSLYGYHNDSSAKNFVQKSLQAIRIK